MAAWVTGVAATANNAALGWRMPSSIDDALSPWRGIVPRMTGNPARAEDAALMRRVAAGDAAACRTLVDRHLDGIVAFAYRMLNDAAEAEDVAQEAFLRLWRGAARWEPRAKVRTWLYRVARNLCIDRLRAQRPSVPVDTMELPANGGGPKAAIHRDQVAALIDGAIAKLPERQREALALVHYQELSNIEAAQIMDVSVEALESLLARGRRTLRQTLDGLRADLLGEP
jgi:RNA polymerase sigma-70 factor (ECF subfamily)